LPSRSPAREQGKRIMAGTLRLALIAVLLSIGCGLFLGETTVKAMQVRRMPDTQAVEVSTGLIDAGLRWAHANHPASADGCPQPTLLFQWGCVLATTN
jgi:hypothetical protein